MRISADRWREFGNSPEWKAIKERLEFEYNIVVNNLVSNRALYKEGRDNFPEVKFERGKAFALHQFYNFVEQIISIIEEEGRRNAGRQRKGVSGDKLGAP